MTTILFTVATLCFVTSAVLVASLPYQTESSPVIGVLSGGVLSVAAETHLFSIAWYWAFLLNIPILLILGAPITKFYLYRFSSGSIHKDYFQSFIGGLITLGIGIILS